MIKIKVDDLLNGMLMKDIASLLEINAYFDADIFNKLNRVVPELVQLKNYLMTVSIQLCKREGGKGEYINGNFQYDFSNPKARDIFLRSSYQPMIEQYYYFDISPIVFDDRVPSELQTKLQCLQIGA